MIDKDMYDVIINKEYSALLETIAEEIKVPCTSSAAGNKLRNDLKELIAKWES